MISDLHIGMISKLNMAILGNSSDLWYDSSASVHVCNNRAHFKEYKEANNGRKVLMGNHNTTKVLGMGSVKIQFTFGKKVTLVNVLYVPAMRKNLVSADLLCKSGLKAIVESNKLILSKNGVFVGKGYSCDGMFKLSINNMINAFAYVVGCSLFLWHERLGHVNFRSLKFMSKYGLINCDNHEAKTCEICVQAKMTRLPSPKSQRNSKILDLVHSNICEMNGTLTRGGKRYFITFIDDCSRYTYVFLMKTKDEAFDMFKIYKALVENQIGKKIKIFRIDRGGKYFPIEFSSFCEVNGMIHKKFGPYTPQKNGLVERKNRTLTEMVNAMILNAKLSINL